MSGKIVKIAPYVESWYAFARIYLTFLVVYVIIKIEMTTIGEIFKVLPAKSKIRK